MDFQGGHPDSKRTRFGGFWQVQGTEIGNGKTSRVLFGLRRFCQQRATKAGRGVASFVAPLTLVSVGNKCLRLPFVGRQIREDFWPLLSLILDGNGENGRVLMKSDSQQ